MHNAPPSGIERAVFGHRDIENWLHRHLHTRLGIDDFTITFRSGRIAAVYGITPSDGPPIAVKAHRQPADVPYLAAVTACQQRLVAAGYPCPQPLDGPATTDGITAVVETLTTDGEPGNGHNPATRSALARSLFEQVEILAGSPTSALQAGAPAWSRYADGPWPPPHDPIFDFTTTPPEFAWLDDIARRACDVLRRADTPAVIAHADWTCGNTLFRAGHLTATWDWDSLAAAPEPVLVGLAAGSHTFDGTSGPGTPTVTEASAFVDDYQQVRSRRFDPPDQRIVAAAITWVLAYNARCQVDRPPLDGGSIQALMTDGDGYLGLSW